MEHLYHTTGNDLVKPCMDTYNAIIDAWAKSGEHDATNLGWTKVRTRETGSGTVRYLPESDQQSNAHKQGVG